MAKTMSIKELERTLKAKKAQLAKLARGAGRAATVLGAGVGVGLNVLSAGAAVVKAGGWVLALIAAGLFAAVNRKGG